MLAVSGVVALAAGPADAFGTGFPGELALPPQQIVPRPLILRPVPGVQAKLVTVRWRCFPAGYDINKEARARASDRIKQERELERAKGARDGGSGIVAGTCSGAEKKMSARRSVFLRISCFPAAEAFRKKQQEQAAAAGDK